MHSMFTYVHQLEYGYDIAGVYPGMEGVMSCSLTGYVVNIRSFGMFSLDIIGLDGH